MSTSAKRDCGLTLQGAAKEKPLPGPKLWEEYFRSEIQPTTTLMLVTILMIFYARTVGA